MLMIEGERRLRNYRATCPRFAIVANISGRNSTADRLDAVKWSPFKAIVARFSES
jgi:hypothetical protein